MLVYVYEWIILSTCHASLKHTQTDSECIHSTVRSFRESIHSDFMLTTLQCFAVEITWYVHFEMLAIIFYSCACFSKSRNLQWRLQIT